MNFDEIKQNILNSSETSTSESESISGSELHEEFEINNFLPEFEPLKLTGKNLAQQYVSAFNTGMNVYQCINYLQGNIDWTINAVNDVVKSWNTEVSESIDQSKAIVRETTTDQFNVEWTNKQPELIEQVNTLTTNQFNEDWGVLENRINTTLETQNTNIQNIQSEQNELETNTNNIINDQNTKINSIQTQQNNLASNQNDQNTKINSIQTQQTNLSNQQTTLSNRMDTFTSLSEGSTTGDAELKDIRVGANGITYNNAGDAVRGQYSQLKGDLVKHGMILEITDVLLKNSGYISLDGTVHDGAGTWFYSDPIDVRNYNNLDYSLYGFNNGGTVVLSVFCKKENGAISCKLYKEDAGEGVITGKISLDDVYEIIICSQKSECSVIAYTTLQDYGIKSIGAISNDIVKNCIPLLNDQNGFISSNGTIQDVPNSYWRYTDYIDVKNYNRLYCKLYSMNVTCYFVGYDKNKEIISKFTGTSDSTEVIENTIDISNISYIRLCSFTADGGEINAILYNICNKNVMNEWNHVVNKPYNFNGKKALFFGDSITKGFTSFDNITENGFPKVFSESVGMNYVNYGVGGYCMADVYSKMLQIANSEYNSSNFVFIADGINDWQTGVPLKTFKNNVISVCELLKNYNFEVIFITPINDCGWESVTTTVATLDEYRNIINEVALSYEYSVLQGNKFTFPNRNNDPSLISYLYGDKLHLTENGYRLYAKNLKTILC